MKEQPFPSRTPRTAPYGHYQVITSSRALEVAGEKKPARPGFLSRKYGTYCMSLRIILCISLGSCPAEEAPTRHDSLCNHFWADSMAFLALCSQFFSEAEMVENIPLSASLSLRQYIVPCSNYPHRLNLYTLHM